MRPRRSRSPSGVIPERWPTRGSSLQLMDDRAKRDARRAYKEAERARERESMILDESQLSTLLDYLDERLAADRCDHTLRFTEAWAAEHSVDASAVTASVRNFGGYCDCEVLANVEPESIY